MIINIPLINNYVDYIAQNFIIDKENSGNLADKCTKLNQLAKLLINPSRLYQREKIISEIFSTAISIFKETRALDLQHSELHRELHALTQDIPSWHYYTLTNLNNSVKILGEVIESGKAIEKQIFNLPPQFKIDLNPHETTNKMIVNTLEQFKALWIPGMNKDNLLFFLSNGGQLHIDSIENKVPFKIDPNSETIIIKTSNVCPLIIKQFLMNNGVSYEKIHLMHNAWLSPSNENTPLRISKFWTEDQRNLFESKYAASKFCSEVEQVVDLYYTHEDLLCINLEDPSWKKIHAAYDDIFQKNNLTIIVSLANGFNLSGALNQIWRVVDPNQIAGIRICVLNMQNPWPASKPEYRPEDIEHALENLSRKLQVTD